MGFPSITNKVLSIKMEMCSRNILKLKFPLIACESSLHGHSKSILIKNKKQQYLEFWSHYWFEVTIYVD